MQKQATLLVAPAPAGPAPEDDEALSQHTYRESVAERRQHAHELRKQTPRRHLGAWRPEARRHDAIDALINSSKGRLPNLVPIRYGRMLASPFTFYRGAAAIMAADLATMPRTGINAQICGDCHLLNFGGFATPERKLVFDINDFDETDTGPWEWDMARLAASMAIAARDRGFSDHEARDAAFESAAAYRDHMVELAGMPLLEAWYEQHDLAEIITGMADAKLQKITRKRVGKAIEQTAHTREFIKLAVASGDPPHIRDEPPLIYHDNTFSDLLTQEQRDAIFAHYRLSLAPERRLLLDRFLPVDFAMKVVGVGSVGTYCGILLLISGSGDPLFLQVKEARDSVISPHTGNTAAHNGARVVKGQRLMQAASDIFLGWTTGPLRDFYIRQLRDAKISPDVQIMKADNLRRYGRLCGYALARAHARSADTLLLSKYIGKSDAFPEAMAHFAIAYANQNERDHAALVLAVREGRVEAQAA